MTDSSTKEKPKCRCGLRMTELRMSGIYACGNCDQLQPQEMSPFNMKRRKTVQDVRFDMSWLQEINRTYTTSPEESEDTSSEDNNDE